MGGPIDGIEHGKNSASGVAKNMFDAVSKHHLVENLTTREPDKGMVQRCIGDGSRSVD